ncbi:MAG: hypothetical protein OEZ13_11655 [Spirochaetia bacterium]|nr:hypothetical protein [Spirochaetia bacterium]
MRKKLFTKGDLNAFFALFLDNLVNLVILTGILAGVFGFPLEIIMTKMIPGTAMGVFIGNIIYSHMAYKLYLKTGNENITAIPLGLDTPSTIGIAFAILGPSFLTFQQHLAPHEAALKSWHVGMSVMILMGSLKIAASFIGPKIQKIVPEAGLLGSLAGIGLVFLAGNHMIQIMQAPFVGLASLIIIMITLIAKYKLPYRLPGAAVSVLAGTIIFYIMGAFGIMGTEIPQLKITEFALPVPNHEGFTALLEHGSKYWLLALPFGLLTVVGGINVTESARVAGDNYNTRDILLTEAFATLIAGIFGGVSQTTPYIGHSAYKKMGARAGYTFFTGILIGLGGILGLLALMVKLIPEAAFYPILVFIGLEITSLAYQMSPVQHNMAVSFSFIPTILYFVYIKVKGLYENILISQTKIISQLPQNTESVKVMIDSLIPLSVSYEYPYLQAVSQGFIITSMIWGSILAFIIDRNIKNAAITCFIAAVFSFFGFIHSATSTGEIYLPWILNDPNLIPYKFSLSYLFAAFLLMSSRKLLIKSNADHI